MPSLSSSLKHPWRGTLPAIVVSLGALAGCGLINSNVFDTEIRLSQQKYTQGFGSATGTIPQVPCGGALPASTCDTAVTALGISNAKGSCDATQAPAQCVATVSSVVSQQVDLSQDASFLSGVGGKAVSALHGVTLYYGVAANTLTFDIPTITVYVGPAGSKAPTDAGVVQIGVIPTIKAGATSGDTASKLQIQSSSPGWSVLSASVQNPKVPFVVLLSTTATLKPPAAVPAGSIELHVTPAVTVGLPL